MRSTLQRFASPIVSWAVCSLMLFAAAGVEAKPLKVFILAGQSNMEGPASIHTFDYIGDDPETAPMLKMMRGADGKPAVCDGAWMSYLTGANEKNFEVAGKLTAGYGSMWGQDPTRPGDRIGPELTFGLTMDASLDEPVLIIKAAWGGKSLHTDFRPPSAGPYLACGGGAVETRRIECRLPLPRLREDLRPDGQELRRSHARHDEAVEAPVIQRTKADQP